MFPRIGVPENGWFVVENPIKMDDLGVPLFLETPIYIYTYTYRRIVVCDSVLRGSLKNNHNAQA